MSQPLVSVIIPAYNAATFLERTLLSVLHQSYDHLEAIVIDDGSSDRTSDIVRAIAHYDSRLRLQQQPNAGVAVARNTGIQAARGEFVAPIDADDIWYPDALEKLVARFQECSSDVGVVYTWSQDIDECDRPIGGFHVARVKGNVYATLICHNFLGNASSTLIRRACLEKIGGYDTRFKAQHAQGCEDWDLYLRLAEQYQFAVVPEFLVGYRKIATSMSGNFQQMARSQRIMLEQIHKRCPELPDFLFRISRSSFYLFLAQQCDCQGNAPGTLFWLRQMVKVDKLTSFSRLGFYLLGLKNIIKKTIGLDSYQASRGNQFTKENTVLNNEICSSIQKFESQDIELTRIFKVQLKVFVSSLLHRSLSRI